MKKLFSVLLALTLVFGCAAAFAEAEPFTITLTANPTTGYDWTYVVSAEDVLSVEQEVLTSADIDKLAGIEPPAEPMPGEGCFYIYTLKGLKPGDAMIAFEYSQAADEDSYAGLTYVLHVNEDLSVVAVASTLGI